MTKQESLDRVFEDFHDAVVQFEQDRTALEDLEYGRNDPKSEMFLTIASGEPFEIVEQTEHLSEAIGELSIIDGKDKFEDVVGQVLPGQAVWQWVGEIHQKQLKRSIIQLLLRIENVREVGKRTGTPTPVLDELARMSTQVEPLSGLPNSDRIQEAFNEAVKVLAVACNATNLNDAASAHSHDDSEGRGWVSVKEAADTISVVKSTISKLCKAKRIRFVGDGRGRRVDLNSLVEFKAKLDAKHEKAEAEAEALKRADKL